ncbi:MAG: hypothetical protein B7Z66_10985 [Chromatiales bacterium 21-64-14]|nr:MAG: hypothetical protein B7Z66_10985 [Chromatiales bacterium 21-64-14]HQU15590.1 cytochrome c [Gammaproteobacteria bacterium]
MKRLLGCTAVLFIATFSAQIFADGNAAAGQQKAVMCAACHGKDGNSTNPQYPRLAGQYQGYIVQALTEYQTGARTNVIMKGMAAGLSKQDIENLAAYFSRQKGVVQLQEQPLHY